MKFYHRTSIRSIGLKQITNWEVKVEVKTLSKSAHWVKCDYKRLDDAGEVQTYIGQGVYCSNCRTGRHKNEVIDWVCCPNCGATIKNIIKSEGDINE